MTFRTGELETDSLLVQAKGTLRTEEGAQLLGSVAHLARKSLEIYAIPWCDRQACKEGNAYRVRKKKGDMQSAVEKYEEAPTPYYTTYYMHKYHLIMKCKDCGVDMQMHLHRQGSWPTPLSSHPKKMFHASSCRKKSQAKAIREERSGVKCCPAELAEPLKSIKSRLKYHDTRWRNGAETILDCFMFWTILKKSMMHSDAW